YYLVPLASVPAWACSRAEQGAAAAMAAKGHPGPFKKQLRHAETERCVLDFIGTGGQVVCPSAGNRRRWVGGEPGQPTVVSFLDLWDAACELAEAHGGKLPFTREGGEANYSRAGTAGPEQDILRRAIAYLAKCDPASSGRAGHSRTFWPARVV